MTLINEIDRRVLNTLSGGEKIKALLSEQGLQLKDFAERENEWVQNVSACIRGERALPGIRAKLAKCLSMERAAIDWLIDGEERAA